MNWMVNYIWFTWNLACKLRTTRTHVIKTLIKEKHWRKTHLTYGTQHGWYLTGSSMPTTQRLSWENKRIKEYSSFW